MNKPRKNARHSLSRPARLLLIYGSYAVFCQLTMILLRFLAEDPTVSLAVLRHVYLPFLEYPLMSLTLLLGGASVIDSVS